MRFTRLWALILAGWLGLHGGRLAIWHSGDSAPSHIFPYRAETYSHWDRHALTQGVPFHDRMALTRLLEDYLS